MLLLCSTEQAIASNSLMGTEGCTNHSLQMSDVQVL
jgi:hypothetical protein